MGHGLTGRRPIRRGYKSLVGVGGGRSRRNRERRRHGSRRRHRWARGDRNRGRGRRRHRQRFLVRRRPARRRNERAVGISGTPRGSGYGARRWGGRCDGRRNCRRLHRLSGRRIGACFSRGSRSHRHAGRCPSCRRDERPVEIRGARRRRFDDDGCRRGARRGGQDYFPGRRHGRCRLVGRRPVGRRHKRLVGIGWTGRRGGDGHRRRHGSRCSGHFRHRPRDGNRCRHGRCARLLPGRGPAGRRHESLAGIRHRLRCRGNGHRRRHGN